MGREETKAEIPLSWPQLGILQETQARDDPRLYQLSFVLESPDDLDPEALDASIRILGRRHPLLGARLLEGSRAPRWSLGAPIPPHHRLKPGKASLDGWLAEALDLGGPLFLAAVGRSEGGGAILAVKWHHLVADGWSFGIIWRDFIRAYQAARDGDAPDEGKSEGRSYADFSAWSRSYPQALEGLADLEFWRSALSYRPPFRSLPLSGPWPPRPGDAPSIAREMSVPMELPRGVIKGRSLFEHCLCAWLIVLYRLSGGEDPLVAIPALGRPGRDFQGTVGHCSNLIHLAADLGGHESFRSLLDQVAARLAAAKAHELLPAALLATELGASAAWPPTEAYCSLVAAPPSSAREFGLGRISQGGSPWAAAFEIQKAGTRASGLLRVPEGLWDEGILRLAAEGLSSLIRAASEDPELPLSSAFPLDDSTERLLARLRASRREEASSAKALAPEEALPENPPSEPELRRVWEVWSDVLGRRDIGTEEDFFLSGGSSLSALRVAARLCAETGLPLPSTIVFHARTARALADRMALLKGSLGQGEAVLPPAPAPRQVQRPRTGEGGRILGSSQARMWYLWRLAPQDPAYHLHVALRFHGKLETWALSQAFRRLCRRHPALRSVFPPGPDGLGRQVVLDGEGPDLILEDRSTLPPDQALQEAQTLASANARAPFALDREPPLRLLLAALPGGEWILSFALHHIIADQWSWGILSRELSALYAAILDGEDPRLPPLASDPARAAEEEEAFLSGPGAAADEAFWRAELSALGPLELLPDRVRPSAPKPESLRIALSADLAARAARAAAAAGVAPSVPYLGAFALALWRRTGQRDFPLAMPSANREGEALGGIVGTFVNTLVIRARVDPSSSPREFLAALGAAFLSAQEHRRYPYERAIRLGRKEGEALSPQAMFNVVNAPMAFPLLPGLRAEPLPLPPAALQFSLSLVVDPLLERMAEFLWDGASFHAEGMRLLADSWLRCLDALCAKDGGPLSSLPLDAPFPESLAGGLSAGEALPYPRRGMAEILWDAAAGKLDRPALLGRGKPPLCYGELFGMAASLAQRLAEEGIGRGDIVAVHLERGEGLVVAFLAIWARAAAYLPIDPAYPRARKRHMLLHSRARLAILGPGHEEAFGTNEGTREGGPPLPPSLILEGPPAPKGTFRPLSADPESPAYLLYTSGSTGLPKGVAVPHRALSAFLHSMLHEPGFPEGERLLSVTSPSFDISGLEYWLPLLAGGSLRIASADEARDPALLSRIIEEDGIGFLQATPATWRLLLEGGWRGRLRRALCGGEAFPPDLVEALRERCEALWNMYGPTETTIWSSLQRMGSDDWPLSVGRPIANTQLRVLDDALRPLPPLCPGDVWISGDGLSLGYHRDERLTAQAFRPIPGEDGSLMYRTGDKGRFLPDGRLLCLGRADSQVKLNGHRIELGELEAVLSGFPGVRGAVCDLRSPSGGQPWLGAWLVMEGGRGLPPPSELEAHVLSRLPSYMLPAAWGLIPSLPLGPGGKVDRRALPPLDPAAGEALPPADDMEERILSVWESVLGLSGFGVERDFFSLGGHSLLALRLVSAIAKETGRELGLREFFLAPTVRGNARALKGSSAGAATLETEVLFPMHPEGGLAPLFLVAGVYADEDGLYRHLAAMVAHMGRERPVYLLRPRGIAGRGRPYASVREAAGDFVQAMRSVQAQGPYLLAGECVGGIHAYETARLLRSQGEEVGALILMDSDYPLPAADRVALSLGALLSSARIRLRSALSLLASGPAAPFRLARGIRGYLRWKRRVLFPLSAEDRKRARFDRIQGRYGRLSRVYPMPPYEGRVELLVNQADNAFRPALGWIDATGRPRKGPREISIAILPGDHQSRLLDHGGETGAAIRAILDSAMAERLPQ